MCVKAVKRKNIIRVGFDKKALGIKLIKWHIIQPPLMELVQGGRPWNAGYQARWGLGWLMRLVPVVRNQDKD